MRGLTITVSDFPRSLPAGSRCDFVSVPIETLAPGDLVMMPSGNLRRFVFHYGALVWVSCEKGVTLECHRILGTVYRAELGAPRGVWMMGTLLGLLPGLYKAWKTRAWEGKVRFVTADPRLLWGRAMPI